MSLSYEAAKTNSTKRLPRDVFKSMAARLSRKKETGHQLFLFVFFPPTADLTSQMKAQKKKSVDYLLTTQIIVFFEEPISKAVTQRYLSATVKPRQGSYQDVQSNIWCHAYNWEPFQRYVVKSYGSALLKLFYRRQQGEVATILVIPHCIVILQQLFKIFDYPQRSDAIMAENQFQGHQEKSKSQHSANRAKGLCERREGIFFSSSFRFSLC